MGRNPPSSITIFMRIVCYVTDNLSQGCALDRQGVNLSERVLHTKPTVATYQAPNMSNFTCYKTLVPIVKRVSVFRFVCSYWPSLERRQIPTYKYIISYVFNVVKYLLNYFIIERRPDPSIISTCRVEYNYVIKACELNQHKCIISYVFNIVNYLLNYVL